jgi:hypothetical protein
MSLQNDTATIAIGAAAAGAFIAAMLWNTAALLPLSLLAASAIVVRPALLYMRERTRLARERTLLKQTAVTTLSETQAQLIQLSQRPDEQKFLSSSDTEPLQLANILSDISNAMGELTKKQNIL